jgi:uncharacterized membrane-anchored protein
MRHNIWLPNGAMDVLKELCSDLELNARGGTGKDTAPSVSALLTKLAQAYQADPDKVANNLQITLNLSDGMLQQPAKPAMKVTGAVTEEQRMQWLREQQTAMGIIAQCALCNTALYRSQTENVDYFRHPEGKWLCRACVVRHKLLPPEIVS